MLTILLALVVIIIILFIIANIQISSYSSKFENFTLSSIGVIRDKIKLHTRNKIISSIKKHKMNKKNEIEDVQIVDNADIYQYLD
jgi:hypothetical protein